MTQAEWGADLLNKVAAEHWADEAEGDHEQNAPAEEEPSGTPDEPQGPDEGEEAPEPDESGETPEAAPDESTGTPPESPATPTAQDVWEYENGLRIDREQAQVYAEFERFLLENPQVAEAISNAVNTQRAPAAPTAEQTGPQKPAPPSAPPEGLDLDDPAVRILWEELQTQRAATQQVNDLIARHEQQLSQQNQATTESLINRASLEFQKAHSLSNDEMTKIKDAAGRLQVLPSLMQPLDPFTGQPRRVDPMQAIDQAFNIAYWQMPELRERELQRVTKEAREDRKRKTKLSALGGSSGSTPRSTSVPNDPKARRDAMIAEVAGFMEAPS